MKRFVDLGYQIEEDNEGELPSSKKYFSFYCTVIEKFVTMSGTQTWDNIEEFIIDMVDEGLNESDRQRYLNLIPEWFNTSVKTNLIPYKITDKEIRLAFSRSAEMHIQFKKCDITEQETWCLIVDTSDGEYGEVSISIDYINRRLQNIKMGDPVKK